MKNIRSTSVRRFGCIFSITAATILSIYPVIIIFIIYKSNHNIQSTHPLSLRLSPDEFFSAPNAFFFTEVDPVSIATRVTCGQSGGFVAYYHNTILQFTKDGVEGKSVSKKINIILLFCR